MALGSNVNPNFPIPGLDQSSKGFRDNFAIIKREIEDIQGTTIEFTGAVIGGPVTLGSAGSIVIPTAVNGSIVALDPPYHAIQFNENGFLKGTVNLIYDSGNISVGIGTSINPNVSISTGKAIHAKDEITIVSNSLVNSANLVVRTNSTNVLISNYDTHVTVGIDQPIDFNIKNSSKDLLYLTSTANVGIGTAIPTAALHVTSNSKDVGRIYTNPTLSDSIFRLVTSDATSTIGVGLEHKAFGRLGGIRIDNQGTVSIHSGESQDAYLSTATARITIDNGGSVGIGNYTPNYNLDVNGTFKSKGITDISTNSLKLVGINKDLPEYTLDVAGDIATSGSVIKSVSKIITIDLNPLIVDSWPISLYRSAKYTLQAVYGTPEVVHIFEFVCFHANNVAFVMPITDLSSGTALGSISASVNAGYLDTQFTGLNIGTTVSISKTYITD